MRIVSIAAAMVVAITLNSTARAQVDPEQVLHDQTQPTFDQLSAAQSKLGAQLSSGPTYCDVSGTNFFNPPLPGPGPAMTTTSGTQVTRQGLLSKCTGVNAAVFEGTALNTSTTTDNEANCTSYIFNPESGAIGPFPGQFNPGPFFCDFSAGLGGASAAGAALVTPEEVSCPKTGPSSGNVQTDTFGFLDYQFTPNANVSEQVNGNGETELTACIPGGHGIAHQTFSGRIQITITL